MAAATARGHSVSLHALRAWTACQSSCATLVGTCASARLALLSLARRLTRAAKCAEETLTHPSLVLSLLSLLSFLLACLLSCLLLRLTLKASVGFTHFGFTTIVRDDSSPRLIKLSCHYADTELGNFAKPVPGNNQTKELSPVNDKSFV